MKHEREENVETPTELLSRQLSRIRKVPESAAAANHYPTWVGYVLPRRPENHTRRGFYRLRPANKTVPLVPIVLYVHEV